MIRHSDKKIRQWLSVFFLLSLLLNVQPAFACTMMSDMPHTPDVPAMPEPTHECCFGRQDSKPSVPEKTGSDADSCFILKASLQIKGSAQADADPGNDHALVKDKQGPQDIAFSMALLVLAVLRVPRAPTFAMSPADKAPPSAIPVYRATQRYRI